MKSRWEFLGECRANYREESSLFVHGSPAIPSTNTSFPRIFTTSARWRRSSALSRAAASRATRTFPVSSPKVPAFFSPDEIDHSYRLDGGRLLCNVGSVGQPRDGDPRACYVLLDDEAIRFRRVEYDVETTIGKIREVSDLDNSLADRLRQGR